MRNKEILEPGIYTIDDEKIIVERKISREALKKTIKIMKKRKGIYI